MVLRPICIVGYIAIVATTSVHNWWSYLDGVSKCPEDIRNTYSWQQYSKFILISTALQKRNFIRTLQLSKTIWSCCDCFQTKFQIVWENLKLSWSYILITVSLIKVLLDVLETCRQGCWGKLVLNSAGQRHFQEEVWTPLVKTKLFYQSSTLTFCSVASFYSPQFTKDWPINSSNSLDQGYSRKVCWS